VNFRNVIIIMTSNLGSDLIRDRMDRWRNKMPENEEEALRNELFMLLRKSLKPEFLNRVDEIVLFKPLTISQIKDIVKIQITNISKILENNNLKLEVSDSAIDWLSKHGFDLQLGARPVKRLIQKEIVNELSKEIIAGKISKEDTVMIDVEKDKLAFANKKVLAD
jgi:ATP-dependent Clp protease ATP-binding subunit ClpB